MRIPYPWLVPSSPDILNQPRYSTYASSTIFSQHRQWPRGLHNRALAGRWCHRLPPQPSHWTHSRSRRAGFQHPQHAMSDPYLLLELLYRGGKGAPRTCKYHAYYTRSGLIHMNWRIQLKKMPVGNGSPQVGNGNPQVGNDNPQVGNDNPQVGNDSPQVGNDSPQVGNGNR